jgi:hypothetical protein
VSCDYRQPFFSEIVAVAQKCVPDPKVDPEIETLLDTIKKESSTMSSLKSAVGQMYKDGKLDPASATKHEVFFV